LGGYYPFLQVIFADRSPSIRRDSCHPYGEINWLHKTEAGARRAATGFAVEEVGRASGGQFFWRVVAKRKDVKAARLGKVDLPKLTPPTIESPHIPDLPTPPTPTKP
jgi:hypothetical protein